LQSPRSDLADTFNRNVHSRMPRTLARTRVSALPAALGLAGAAVALLLWSRLDYVPIWDGYEYAAAIDRAARAPFELDNLRLAGHTSHVYAVLVAAAQAIAPGQYWPLLVTNTVLLAVAALGFHRLSGLAFPGADEDTDRALLTSAFVLQPALVAAVVQPGIDLPLVPGFVWAAVFLLERRFRDSCGPPCSCSSDDGSVPR
jgi:hypothetical protein